MRKTRMVLAMVGWARSFAAGQLAQQARLEEFANLKRADRVDGAAAAYDLFGRNEQHGALRVTCYFDAFDFQSADPGAGCFIELGDDTRNDVVYLGTIKLASNVLRAYERSGGVLGQIGSDISYSGESVAMRLTKETNGYTTIDAKLGAGDWQTMGSSNAIDGIASHAVVFPSFRAGFQPRITR